MIVTVSHGSEQITSPFGHLVSGTAGSTAHEYPEAAPVSVPSVDPSGHGAVLVPLLSLHPRVEAIGRGLGDFASGHVGKREKNATILQNASPLWTRSPDPLCHHNHPLPREYVPPLDGCHPVGHGKHRPRQQPLRRLLHDHSIWSDRHGESSGFGRMYCECSTPFSTPTDSRLRAWRDQPHTPTHTTTRRESNVSARTEHLQDSTWRQATREHAASTTTTVTRGRRSCSGARPASTPCQRA
jgi:hypothetical protein